ncbi:PAS domain-containing protein [Methylobacterium durans]|uniref:PAS domain-containing protein n=1 Tax=Methylobacterium durans TaxID=2202825 RepID=UPI002AFECCB9|nr:PAS domain-containing protein [Methylobacterium durans]MEA1832237.1 PAS domain-containing protein [Methylobacterium durans]
MDLERVTPQLLAFSSRQFLELIEHLGLTGTWGWTFATNEHVWSNGLYRLLGLERGTVRPSYDLFLNLVHPDDRATLKTAAELRQGIARDEVAFRVIRPDGVIRTLSSRIEVYFFPDGRPRAAAGTVLDVTHREALSRAQAAERRRHWALFELTRAFQFTASVEGKGRYPQEMYALTGVPEDVLSDDNFHPVDPEERECRRAAAAATLREGGIVDMAPMVILKGGVRERFRIISVPVRDARGVIVEWTAITFPAASSVTVTDRARQGLEQAVQGHHMRAARSLLDWSMHDLAAASGLSFSTIRRLEEDAEATASRSRHAAIAALRTAGIRFEMLGGVIAVGRA